MARPITFRRSLVFSIALLIALLVNFTTATPTRAAGTVINCSDDSAFSSVLSGGGLVNFDCGTQTIVLSSTKTISANTTIDGGGKITLNAAHSLRQFVVNGGVTLTLKNITLTAGYNGSSNGGTIYNAGHLWLDNTTIRDGGNSNFYGGAIATLGALDVTNSRFINNNAGSGGAIFAIGNGAVVTISGSTFQDNSVASNNPDSKRGGAIYIANGATLHLSTSVVDSNSGAYGSGIANDNSTVNLTDVTVSGNETPSTGAGGGLHNAGTANLTRVTFVENSVSTGSGGGLFNKGTANLSNVWFLQNDASYGGGIVNDHGELSVINGLFTQNQSNVAGGGGIASTYSTMTLANVTFFQNSATGDAGGVENGKGTATLTNVTFSENSSSSGGGMWNLFGGVATLNNVTFTGNRGSSSAGGIGNSNDPDTHLYLKNIVISNSTAGDNCVFQKAPDSSSSNLSSDNSCNFGSGRDGVTIQLGKLESNGGALVGVEQTPLPTHRPLRGSAVIDKGEFIITMLTDERGVTRPRGAAFDVGAVEFVPCTGNPPKAERIEPLQNEKVTTAQVLLDWAGPDCAKKFNVVVRLKSKTGPIVFSKNNLKTSQVKTNTLAVNKAYVWQVTACVGTKCTVSDWFKFKRKP